MDTGNDMKVQESMRIITEMVNNSRYNIGEDKFIYLMWGYAVALSALVHYGIEFVLNLPYGWLVWISMPIAGIFNGVYFAKKAKSHERPKSFIDRVLASVWTSFIVALFAILFAAPAVDWDGIYPMLMILYGIGTSATGGVIRYNNLRFGGFLSIAIGLFAFYVSFEYQQLLIALSVLVCYIVPGHLLPSSSK